MTDYPRSKNGYVDSGKPVACSIGRKCPNCGSSQYRSTVSLESCPACGLRCDYWGGGSNDVYNDMMDRRAAEDEAYRKKMEEDDDDTVY
jgi:hypothetical protein